VARKRRVIAPREVSTYVNSEQRMYSGTMRGDYCFNSKTTKIQVIYPNDKAKTIFRPFAALDPLDPANKLLPGRLDMNRHGQTDWIIQLPVVKFVGTTDQKCTYITHDPTSPDDKAFPGQGARQGRQRCTVAN